MTNPRIEDVLSLAHEAGALLLERFESGPAAGLAYKGQVDLVTDADRDAEELVKRRLQSSFPDHAILAEESAEIEGDSEDLWVLDPLDGTTNFVHRYPIFAVSLAFRRRGETRLGVIHVPYLRETYHAERGKGAFRNGDAIGVSRVDEILGSLLVTGFADVRARNSRNTLRVFQHLLPRSRGVRRSGSAAYDLACVASGRCDGFWELGLNPWDIAAGVLLVEEAGGRVTDFEGGGEFEARGELVASNGTLHESIRKVCFELAAG